MHDKNGTALQEGDIVSIEARIKSVQATPDYCNCTVETTRAMPPHGSPTTVTLNTKMVLLLEKAAAAVALLLLLFCTMALPAGAQDTNQIAPPNPATLPQTILGYFTTFNTNMLTFRGTTFDLWTGASSIQGGDHPLVNDIGFSYDVWHPKLANTTSPVITALAPEAVLRNEGLAGSIVSAQVGLGFSFIIWDTKVTLYLDGGGYLDSQAKDQKFEDKIFGEVGLRVKKGFGDHFYGGVGLGAQFPRGEQVFTGLLGVTF